MTTNAQIGALPVPAETPAAVVPPVANVPPTNKEAVTLDESMALLDKLQKQSQKDPSNAAVTASNKDEGYVR